MAGSRFNAIAKANWAWLGPAFKGLSDDLEAVEAGGGGSGGAVTTSNLQAGLGLSSGSTTSATKSLLTGKTGATWVEATDTSSGYTIGNRFTAAQAATLTHFRYRPVSHAYDGTALTFGLYSDAGTLLTQQSWTPTAATPLDWTNIALTTPYQMTAGSTYRVAVFVPLKGGTTYMSKIDVGWSGYSVSGVLTASETGGNGWLQWGSALTFPASASAGLHAWGVDVVASYQTADSSTGVRLPVVAYYSDANAATVARPTSDPLTAVLWFNNTGTATPTAALANIDKVFTL